MISECISNDIPPKMKSFEYGYPFSNAFMQRGMKLKCYKPHKAAGYQTKCDVIMTSNCLQQKIAEYTVANVGLIVRCHVTKSSALEYRFILKSHSSARF